MSLRAIHVVVTLLCAISLSLAAGWALVLPLFLSPDEDSHYDYALTLYTAGRPLRASENLVGRDTHPTVAYLVAATHVRQQRLDTAVGADAGYGTAAYFRALDAGAPKVDARAFRSDPIEPAPYVGRLYPIGYYALAAFAIGIGDLATHGSAVGEVFFARFLSVALLVSTLIFTWLALRDLVGARRALPLFACTALLPMTAWMAGYVQPDNLVCALVAPLVYLALRLRKRPDDPRALAALGILLAALMATKQQYFLAVFVPVAAMLAVRLPWRMSAATVRALAWLIVPALAAYAATAPMMHAAPGGGGVCHFASLGATAQRLGPAHVARLYENGLLRTFESSFFPSAGVESFWLAYTAYRNTLLTVATPGLTRVVAAVVAPLSLIVAVLFCMRVAGVLRRLALVARRRSWRSAARIATSNVLVNAYLCYFAILCGYEMTVGGYIPVQGRYWLPFVSAVWLIAIAIAPRALPPRYARTLGPFLLTLILGFEVVTSGFTFSSLHNRFYAPLARPAASAELLADVSARAQGDAVRFSGAAMDLRDASPADRVVVRVDDRIDLPARRVARPDVECDMEATLLNTGFEASIPSAKLAAGAHTVALLVATPWSHGLVDTGAHASFRKS